MNYKSVNPMYLTMITFYSDNKKKTENITTCNARALPLVIEEKYDKYAKFLGLASKTIFRD